ncbi:glycosyltransferase [Candidatus Falkowbacteria bacterium]|nr:MAG: glycosyltransferase [Candidatus Falkowbacteria bacterium]
MFTKQPHKSWIVSLSTFPPQKCGIATFTSDLSTAFNQLYAPAIESKIIAINSDPAIIDQYPSNVVAYLRKNYLEDYVKIAEKINTAPQIKVVSIQHEFGIYGGNYGDYLLHFTSALEKPLIITFHTVLPDPPPEMKQVVQALAKRAQQITTMTHTSKKILESIYAIPSEQITVIPHGIHPTLFAPSIQSKKILGLPTDKTIISTFGLLSRGKGIEYVIEALPEVIKQYPHILYLIIGATHPVIIQEEGEAYRDSLQQRIAELGLNENIRFINSYIKTSQLLTYLSATDIYLATPLDPNQAVSGTLSYAMGAGRPVISTAFAQAKEDVTSESGILVDFRNSKQISQALINLLSSPERQNSLGKLAYFKTRNMTWANVCIAYMRTFVRNVPELKESEKRAPKISLRHLKKLTTDFGIIQFALLTEPDLTSGYTLDDNARALQFTVLYYQHKKSKTILRLIEIYLHFLAFVHHENGVFENYVTAERIHSSIQNNHENLEDANGRALYALSITATAHFLPKEIKNKARQMYEKSIENAKKFTSPRAIASYIKSLAIFLKEEANPKYLDNLIAGCDLLVSHYRANNAKDWEWFEQILSYSNGAIPEALIISSKITGNQEYYTIGKKTLDFLISHTFEDGIYIPIGQDGWFKRGGHRHKFDQQPEDVATTITALKSMYEISQDRYYQKCAYKTFDWFLGGNVLGRIMYDQSSGGCYDGLRENEINLNQGAESTLSYLLSRLIL